MDKFAHDLFVSAIAAGLFLADRLLFNGLWSGWILIACRLEERDLVADFGDAYLCYREKAPVILPWKIPRRSDRCMESNQPDNKKINSYD